MIILLVTRQIKSIDRSQSADTLARSPSFAWSFADDYHESLYRAGTVPECQQHRLRYRSVSLQLVSNLSSGDANCINEQANFGTEKSEFESTSIQIHNNCAACPRKNNHHSPRINHCTFDATYLAFGTTRAALNLSSLRVARIRMLRLRFL